MIEVENILKGSALLIAVKNLKIAVAELEQFAIESVSEARSDIVKEVELAGKVRQAMDKVTVTYLEAAGSDSSRAQRVGAG
ncbi:hypothetical protein [Parasutterella sp.]|uniref:hypothetical protein n=1 Tax=Parasutterella sp. TaxID=2049037 RepID=UPI00352068F5